MTLLAICLIVLAVLWTVHLLAYIDMKYIHKLNVTFGGLKLSDFVCHTTKEWLLLPLQIIAILYLFPVWTIFLWIFPDKK